MNAQVMVALVVALVAAAVSYGVLIQQMRQTRADVREIKKTLNGDPRNPGLVQRVDTLERIESSPGHRRHRHSFQEGQG